LRVRGGGFVALALHDLRKVQVGIRINQGRMKHARRHPEADESDIDRRIHSAYSMRKCAS
jgi:hypothetical protein